MKSGTKRIAALARGLEVLRAVYGRPGASLHELHGATGLAKATLLRALRTLEDRGFVARRLADGAYLPVPLAAAAAPSPIAEAAGPALETLARTIAWPTDLGVRDGRSMVVLESNRRLSPIRVNRQALGARPHMLWSAMGRAYLAFCPPAEREEILALLRASNAPEDRVARDRRALDRLLGETRARGYGVRDPRYGVLDVGRARQVSAIAVPVRRGESVAACLNCVWLVDVLDEAAVVERHLPALQAAASDIAAKLRRLKPTGDGARAASPVHCPP
ncbi:MAG TPA: IclR family transcriptional regulator C-terminal domain-containing protein [Burkholderiales bacterium]|nr:IclR family transcriptional regulator C-terminal domain-containing protein [Burkholderiales bacterium]